MLLRDLKEFFKVTFGKYEVTFEKKKGVAFGKQGVAFAKIRARTTIQSQIFGCDSTKRNCNPVECFINQVLQLNELSGLGYDDDPGSYNGHKKDFWAQDGQIRTYTRYKTAFMDIAPVMKAILNLIVDI